MASAAIAWMAAALIVANPKLALTFDFLGAIEDFTVLTHPVNDALHVSDAICLFALLCADILIAGCLLSDPHVLGKMFIGRRGPVIMGCCAVFVLGAVMLPISEAVKSVPASATLGGIICLVLLIPRGMSYAPPLIARPV